jgi:hypothetical protein
MNIPFNIFPVGPDKRPMVTGWQEKATKDPVTIERWRTYGAQAWGIPCGATNDLFVIDLDIDKQTGDPIGEQSLRSLGRYDALLNFINVRTPSGGGHIYLKHFQGARNTTSKLGHKIDTRGEGGYVVAPGSSTDGGTYKGYCPSPLAVTPLGLRAMLLHTPQAPAVSFERTTPTGEVEELLKHIPADLTYSDWVSVLMALHDRYSGSDEGLAIADQWSALGAKYRNGEVAAKWRSFKRNGVSWATVPALARQNGANLSEIARRWAA